MPAPNEITQSQLNRLIGTPDCPVIIDVRIDADFAEDPRMIPTALRWDFNDSDAAAAMIGDRRAVVSCHKGLKLSQGFAAILRNLGVACEFLQGGHVAWADANLPLIQPAPTNSLWVTRHRPKIDRIACPWLIRRFIDPTARFLFVSPSQVLNVAEKFNATAFDVPDCDWTHSGDACTFDAFLKGFDLSIPALDHMARIIRAADTDTLSTAPEAAGLLALSLGLSRMYRDDLEQLEQGLLLYDALYRWARDATKETHIWDETA
ncbi:chromate resistance protein ChrB domain-containing protein [Amylibacter sp. IMCC11727]|uniref:chromate resistance protein ChrB domain-containing protein n=1 Tax=Amylibacter sp. IMCC11727 TaxID=3039851 RepID=UPI00244DFB84|nr:chromate resistance protein ChrB domain-containing protein [Amylibacter sp. IMCC11727]WGI21402.1 chromate resistance protein [Amylibacter sp. IMCC11727]